MITKCWNRLPAAAKTVVAAAGVLLMLAGLLAGLGLARAAGDERLFTQVYARPLGEAELDPQAAALPLVRALWEKHLYYDGTDYQFETESAQRPARVEDVDFAEALYQAGVMPNPDDWLPQPYTAPFVVAQDFAWVESCLVYGGVAVSAYATVPKSTALPNLADACRHYVAYLGLEELGDWQAARLFDVPDMDSAALYSAKAQLLVQVVADSRYLEGKGYSCSATPLARDVFARQNLEGGGA